MNEDNIKYQNNLPEDVDKVLKHAGNPLESKINEARETLDNQSEKISSPNLLRNPINENKENINRKFEDVKLKLDNIRSDENLNLDFKNNGENLSDKFIEDLNKNIDDNIAFIDENIQKFDKYVKNSNKTIANISQRSSLIQQGVSSGLIDDGIKHNPIASNYLSKLEKENSPPVKDVVKDVTSSSCAGLSNINYLTNELDNALDKVGGLVNESLQEVIDIGGNVADYIFDTLGEISTPLTKVKNLLDNIDLNIEVENEFLSYISAKMNQLGDAMSLVASTLDDALSSVIDCFGTDNMKKLSNDILKDNGLEPKFSIKEDINDKSDKSGESGENNESSESGENDESGENSKFSGVATEVPNENTVI